MTDSTGNTSWIINTTDQTFEADVFTRSQLGLVIVDFWAEWCAPCRILAPVLEKLANDHAGQFTLVKANTDANQQAASHFRVSGIPAVYAVVDAEVVDAFQGVLPENSIQEWLNKSLTLASLSDAQRLMVADPVAAEKKLRAILEQSPNVSTAWVALAELLLQLQRDDECREIVLKLEQEGFLEARAEKVKAALDIKGKATVNIEAARNSAAEEPDNFSSQLALAEALAGNQEYMEALDLCLSLISRDRNQTGEKARQLMLEIFCVLPDDSELTREYRRKLSMALY